jgi:hypothetical protein
LSRAPQARSILFFIVPVLAGVVTVACQSNQHLAQANEAPTARTIIRPAEQAGKLTCPGGFPTDLTSTNCEYTANQRVEQWVATSITDQSILGALVYGTGAEILRSPSEWPRTWRGLGYRIGVRYTQAAARGSAEFVVGSLMRDDPRHLSYKDDPHTHYGVKTSCSTGTIVSTSFPALEHIGLKRVGHAFLDSISVLRSSPCGDGQRIPALDRLVGIWAGAYGGYAWYPRAENTFANAGQRAASAYGSTLVGSFYTEFSPEISLGLSKLFARRNKSK